MTETLTEFLLARIAEDESAAMSIPPTIADAIESFERIHAARWLPARVLAECEAKRRIVEAHPIYRGDRIQPIDTSGTDFGCELCHRLDAINSDSLIEAVGYCDTLRALALPYADHPDCRKEWRP